MAGDLGGAVEDADIGVGGDQGQRPAHGLGRDGIVIEIEMHVDRLCESGPALQADAYGGYDAFFKEPARGLTEVGCGAHARRYFHKALESDRARMGPALLLIAQRYRVEEQARPLTAEERLGLRQLQSRSIPDKLHAYLLEIQAEVLPKSPAGRAVRYTLT